MPFHTCSTQISSRAPHRCRQERQSSLNIKLYFLHFPRLHPRSIQKMTGPRERIPPIGGRKNPQSLLRLSRVPGSFLSSHGASEILSSELDQPQHHVLWPQRANVWRKVT